MSAVVKTIAAAALVAAAAGAGYWWGTRGAAHPPQIQAQAPAPAAASADAKGGKKILYYRNPMGLPDTSPVPKKDSMGMDYIPVYEGEEPGPTGSEIRVSTEKVQRLGVRTEPATVRELSRTVRAVGTLEVDERRVSTVAPKFEGWIERLHVNTTGQPVARGQPLMDVYSPDLVTAQQEYLIAARGANAMKEASPEIQASMRQLMSSALARLRNWDVSDEELQRLEREGTMRRTITLRSPVSGVVIEKPALKGMRFMPGEVLYQISDLSSLWLVADIFEQDLGLVRSGQAAKITVNAYPGRTFNGKVSFFYPTVASQTRAGKVRIELANPAGLLKPAMYAQVELAAGERRRALTVPGSAVLDSGLRRLVLVQVGEGRFEPREVAVGAVADDYMEILKGVKEGEAVVVAANFLIDAESNLKAAIGGFQAPGASAAGAEGAPKGAKVSHQAEGSVSAVDAKAGSVSVNHGPVASLKWPAMTMEFNVANRALLEKLKPGAIVEFEFVERKPGEWVITRVGPDKAAKPVADHTGHR